MQLFQDILSQWSNFVTEWCLGVEPVESPSEVNRAFAALHRLWPGYLKQLEVEGKRGLLTVASTVQRGLVLAECEPLRGFGPVMERVRQGEESAFAELEFAAALVGGGFTLELEPQLDLGNPDSRKPDCLVTVGSERVFAEVIAPESAKPTKAARDASQQLADVLIEKTLGTRTEILLEAELVAPFDSIIDGAIDILPDEAVHHIDGIGLIHRAFLGPLPPILGPLIPNPERRPSIGVSTMRRSENGLNTAAVIRHPMADKRAHALYSKELRHFSKQERNILVVRVTNVTRGLERWLPLTLRWFQPYRNRRVGAVVLYEQALFSDRKPTSRQRWHVVKNPYADMHIPDSLIHTLLARDESCAWGDDAAKGNLL